MTWHKNRPCKCARCVDCGHEQIRPQAADALRWWCVSCRNVLHEEATA